MWGVPRSTPILGLGRQVYLVFPHYKLQSQKEHSKSTSWNLPPSLEALIQHSKGGHPGPPKMGAHSHKSEGSGHRAGLWDWRTLRAELKRDYMDWITLKLWLAKSGSPFTSIGVKPDLYHGESLSEKGNPTGLNSKPRPNFNSTADQLGSLVNHLHPLIFLICNLNCAAQ